MELNLKMQLVAELLADYAVSNVVDVAFYNALPTEIKIKLNDSTTEQWYSVSKDDPRCTKDIVDKIVKHFEAHRLDVASLYPRTMIVKNGEYIKYFESDVRNTMATFNLLNPTRLPEIEDVIFNDPATIVFWSDHTKTVVKTQNGEAYDPEKGLAMAISKKVLGNDYGYYETFARHIGRYEKRKKKEAAK